MKNYYIISDLEKSNFYLYWEYLNTDILGAIIGFANKQNTQLKNIRVYCCKTKKEWEKFGLDNFSKIAFWRCK